MLRMGLALAAVAFIGTTFTEDPVLLGAAAFLLGLGLGCGQPLSMILTFNAAPPNRTAEANAMRLSMGYAAHVFVPPFFGVMASLAGLTPIFLTCAFFLGGGWALTAVQGVSVSGARQ